MKKKKLGIVMGQGALPRLLVEACKEKKESYLLLPMKKVTEPCSFIEENPHAWISPGKIGKTLEILAHNGVTHLVFGGTVSRPSLFSLKFDWKGVVWLFKIGLKIKGDDGLLSRLAHLLEKEGFKILGPHNVVEDLLMPAGVLGKIKPQKEDKETLKIGFLAAKDLGRQDIGQAVIVEGKTVLGRETQEGTEKLVEKTASLLKKGGRGFLVKTSKPGQEFRMDLPTIGPQTILSLARYGYKGVVLEAGAGLILDKKKVISLANQKGIFVYGPREKDL